MEEDSHAAQLTMAGDDDLRKIQESYDDLKHLRSYRYVA